MNVSADPLVLDFVEWVAREPRPYSEVVATWRTSCPRLTIWEDASDAGYVARETAAGVGIVVPLPMRASGCFATMAGEVKPFRFLSVSRIAAR